jgi:tRNA U34 5-carboxymethylaminomethyl modifying enzyme MnmG/GidA
MRRVLKAETSLKKTDKRYEVVVVGAGVAGCHAALAAASAGAKTLLLTSSWDSVATLAWGPHLAEAGEKAIRRLGGFPSECMVKATICRIDDAGVDGRFLDGLKYQRQWKKKLEDQEGLTVFQDTCDDIGPGLDGWLLSTLWGVRVAALEVVVAVGTFLGSEVELGAGRMPGGRPGQTGSSRLERALMAGGSRLVDAARSSGLSVWVDRIEQEEAAPAGGAVGAPKSQAYRIVSTNGVPLIMAPTTKGGRLFYVLASRAFDTGAGPPAKLPEGVEVVSEGFTVRFRRLAPDQPTPPRRSADGLLFAGQVAGAANYGESAAQGWLAGAEAAVRVSRET